MQATYQREKGWVQDVEPMFPKEDLPRGDLPWFIATRRNEPMGVLRVRYDPPMEQYQKYGLTPLDGNVAVYDFIKSERIAGRDARVRIPRLHAARDRCFRE